MPAQPAGLAAEHDVLGHGEVGEQVDLLVDGADAGLLRLAGTRERDLPARHQDLTGVDRVDPGQRLDQGRLAGAVLPHQRVHLAGEEPEVDGVEGLAPGNEIEMPVISTTGCHIGLIGSVLFR